MQCHAHLCRDLADVCVRLRELVAGDMLRQERPRPFEPAQTGEIEMVVHAPASGADLLDVHGLRVGQDIGVLRVAAVDVLAQQIEALVDERARVEVVVQVILIMAK